MAQITALMVKELRTITGAGPLDCKKALEQFDGDVEKAVDFLREKGIAKATKKLGSDRTMNEGVVEVYQHFNKRLGVLVEVNCETDFVAATDTFKGFAKDVALHIANLSPSYLNREDVPEDVIATERDLQLQRALDAGKPPHIAEKIVEGRMDKFYEEIVLMEQAFIKDDSKTINDLLQEAVAELGERIQISRFSRFGLGENNESGEGGDEE